MARALRFLPSPVNSCTGPSHLPKPAAGLSLPLRATSSCLTSTSISLTTISAARVLPTVAPPFTLCTTSFASAVLPARTSHRGVSGMRNSTAAWSAAGTAPRPTIQRQAVAGGPKVASSQPVTYATIWPRVMNSTLVVTSLPRCDAGATSAMYSGTTKLAAPTAAPITHRPTTMPTTVALAAWQTAPAMKRRSAQRMTRFRPSESARTEEKGEISRAKSAVEEVMMDLSVESSSWPERPSPMETRVAEMTPVSSKKWFCQR